MVHDAPPTTRAAVVAIHGIGDQPPAATLGEFTQGIMDHAGAEAPCPVLVHLNGQPRTAVRFTGLGDLASVDVFEFAWQAHVHGRITAGRVLRWLLGVLLAPLHFRSHWRILAKAQRDSPSPWRVVLNQLLIAAAILLTLIAPLALALVALVRVIAALPVRLQLPDPGPTSVGEGVVFGLGLLFGLLTLLLVSAALQDAREAMRIQRRTRRNHDTDWRGLHGGVSRGWRLPALVTATLSLASAVVCAWLTLDTWRAVTGFVAANLPLAGAFVVLLLATWVFFWVVRMLVRYVGDLTLYVASDDVPAHARTREEIRDEATGLLAALLRDDSYGRVVVAGHSLGSVIAYDALNQLSREARAERAPAPPRLRKLRGLLTFGAPLDKVAYFFREKTRDDQSVYAQLLSFTHPTRRLPSQRDDGPYRLREYRVPFRALRWTHLHAPADPISDPLVFYDVDRRVNRTYWPTYAHGAYWRDGVLYEELLALLRD